MKTLDKISWDKIEVGEVYACDAKYLGWIILHKVDEKKSMDLAYSYIGNLENEGDVFTWADFSDPLYKLPKSVQRLWRED